MANGLENEIIEKYALRVRCTFNWNCTLRDRLLLLIVNEIKRKRNNQSFREKMLKKKTTHDSFDAFLRCKIMKLRIHFIIHSAKLILQLITVQQKV